MTSTVLHGALAYDFIIWVCTVGRERRFREGLVQLARLDRGDAVLDVGCGTGSLAMTARARVGGTGEVCGIDPSPEMVARARRKAARAGVDVRFETGAVEALPFPDTTFDVVLSTLMLHHLAADGREQGLGEIARVLKAGGRFLAVDFGAGGKGHRHLLGRRRHAEFDVEEVVPLFEQAGLHVVEKGPVPSPAVLGLSNLHFLLAVAPPG